MQGWASKRTEKVKIYQKQKRLEEVEGYTEQLYKRSLIDADNQYDVVIHLEPDILECIRKWA